MLLVVGGLAVVAALGTRAFGGTRATAATPRTASPGPSRFPSFDRAVPVLLYHGLIDRRDGRSVAPAAFDAQLERLHELGFDAIPLDRYVAFMRGERVELPPRPILITFDDGYVSSWRNADAALARFGWSAAMYVPTGAVGRPGHLTWAQLRQLQASGRWQVDEHAGNGHVRVRVAASGRRGPFYANELWTGGRQETFAHYKRRVSTDVERGAALLARRLGDARPHRTFAVPYSNYGQFGSNDRRIEPWLRRYLETRFAVSFVQGDASFTRPGQGFANRIMVSSRWGAETLELHLRRGLRQLPAADRGR